MFRRMAFVLGWCAVLSLAVQANSEIANGQERQQSPPEAGLIRFDVPGGETVYALSLPAHPGVSNGAREKVSRDVVIVIDTSASQAGEFRQQGLGVLESCLAALDGSDRVRLIAVDTQIKSLSDGFSGPRSTETIAALEALRQRVPLGATELQPALETALKSFDGDRSRAMIYIGDGMSTGKLIEWTGFRKLINELRRQQVPVNSYLIGPRTDLQVAGVLAVHTGGLVMVDAHFVEEKQSAEKLGQQLARAADAAIFFADELTVTPEVDNLLPGVVPPIRSDRDTILLGKGAVGNSLRVTASGAGRSLSWTVEPPPAQQGNSFLARLWQLAEQSDGLLIATAGNELLNAARDEFEDQVQEMVNAGRQAIVARDLKRAEEIAKAIRQVDPANVDAESILDASQKIKARTKGK
jgi:hypothetical protein